MTKENETITHPSFGAVTLSRSFGGDTRMFGSALRHAARITVSVRGASIERRLGDDRIIPDHTPICEFHFTETDFARFVCSAGIGEGTPCTFSRRYDEAKGEYVRVEEPPVHMGSVDTFKSEISGSVKKSVEGAKSARSAIKDLLGKKSVTKTDLAEIVRMLDMAVQDMEANAPFYVSQAEEAVEKMVTKAKGEIEAFTRNAATFAGLENLKAIASLDDKTGDYSTYSTGVIEG